jgi:hypothetical protein
MSIIQTCVAQAIKKHPEAAAREVTEILDHYILDNARLNRIYQLAKAVCVSPSPRNRLALAMAIKEAEGQPNPCAWCQKEKGEVSPPGVSHGICERHRDEMLKEASQCGHL